MFVINTRCNAKHSCPGGYIIFRTDNCFDVKTPLSAIKPTIGIRRFIPGAPFIANFSTSDPATGLALGQTCQSGRWQKAGKTSWRVGGTFTVWPGQTQTLGRFKLCINTYRIDGREMALTQLVPTDAPDADGNMNWQAYNGTQYPAYYMGIHCFI